MLAVKRFPLNPARPERNCWGCDRYCASNAMACGNGSDRTQHPAELFGPDWNEWQPPSASPAPMPAAERDAQTAPKLNSPGLAEAG